MTTSMTRAPAVAGLYALWARPAVLPALARPVHLQMHDLRLLYVGIATRLRSRLGVKSPAPDTGRTPTRRRAPPDALDRPRGPVRRRARLTEWMTANMRRVPGHHVMWEAAIIRTLRPPLNVDRRCAGRSGDRRDGTTRHPRPGSAPPPQSGGDARACSDYHHRRDDTAVLQATDLAICYSNDRSTPEFSLISRQVLITQTCIAWFEAPLPRFFKVGQVVQRECGEDKGADGELAVFRLRRGSSQGYVAHILIRVESGKRWYLGPAIVSDATGKWTTQVDIRGTSPDMLPVTVTALPKTSQLGGTQLISPFNSFRSTEGRLNSTGNSPRPTPHSSHNARRLLAFSPLPLNSVIVPTY
jgi:hypothetical protein